MGPTPPGRLRNKEPEQEDSRRDHGEVPRPPRGLAPPRTAGGDGPALGRRATQGGQTPPGEYAPGWPASEEEEEEEEEEKGEEEEEEGEEVLARLTVAPDR
ncbi:unnamed protein product [Prorocentrum cordatum]|uniref:Uncharacterized protein n=1 Tax=Prorocentrum cordatum TaxID=2364126 RepID=A0ABN9WV18_9DINO|nr:unnamed protein product [Polarella glacialis]